MKFSERLMDVTLIYYTFLKKMLYSYCLNLYRTFISDVCFKKLENKVQTKP